MLTRRRRLWALIIRRPAGTLATLLLVLIVGYVLLAECAPAVIGQLSGAVVAEQVPDRSTPPREEASPEASSGSAAGTAVGPSASAHSEAAGSAGAAPGTEGASGTGEVVIIHVAGAVHHPGVYRLPVQARVEAAVTAAGGASDGADLSGVNLARLVVDGEQIIVPESGAGVQGAGPGGPQLSLNTASEAELDALPRVGPALAKKIVEWRKTHGPFATVDSLQEVSGVGQKMVDSLRPLVRV